MAEVAPDPDVLTHRASHQRDLAVERVRGVDDLLDTVDVGGEARHHDPTLTAREDLLEVRADDRLRRGEAGTVDVRRVAAQQEHALAAEFGQTRYICRRTVDGRLVELVVAGDQHRAELGAECDRAAVGDRVRHMHHLKREGTELEAFAGLDLVQLDIAQLVLIELGARHRDRQRAAVDGRLHTIAEVAQDPWQRTEMVLVAVRDHDRLDVLSALAQVGEVGEHEVDANHLRGREAQADVDHDDAAVVLDHRHVLADLAETPEG